MNVDKVATVAVKRGVTLAGILFIIVILTAVIIGVTGYDVKVLNALIDERLRGLRQTLQQQKPPLPQEEIEKIVKQEEEKLRRFYRLDDPWYVRLLPMAIMTFKLDLNVTSDDVANVAGIVYPATVREAIEVTLPRTIVMITIGELIAMSIALPLGPYIAYKRGSIVDKSVVSYAALANAIPIWWLAMLFIFIFGYQLGVAPTRYREILSYLKWDVFVDNPLGTLANIAYYAYLPILVTSLSFLGGWLYSVRAVAIRVVSEDFVVVGRAKGMPERVIVTRYILRVIAGPVLTFAILGLAGSISGFIITEAVFNWPGMGTLYYQAILSGDSPTILGVTYVTTLAYIVGRYILEILYVIVDPRVEM